IALIAITVIINLWFGKLIDVHGAYAKHFADIGRPYWPNDHWTKTWIIILSGLMLGLSYVSSVARKLQRNQLAFALSEKERVLAELAFLKAQINPHFFFNTLHTIYALMDTNIGSAKTSIYSLSHMMRYVLYETKNELTTLSKEIEFIDDYIALMKVRIASNVQVIFEKPIGLNDLPIAPMLFLPFIENAFKHGISAVTPSYISIDIFKKNKKLVFEVRNSLFTGMAKQLEDEHGIGIANTRRRLDLIYPDKYDLVVERDDFAREFIVTLTLNIDDN
ncbi:MAG: sensor histidine kinase, partial [Pedobacter sp.]